MSVKEYITKINETGNSYLAEVKEHACSAALTDPQQCVDFINQAFDAAHLSEEHFYVIATDTKSKPIAVFDVAHGVIDGAYAVSYTHLDVYKRQVKRSAVIFG